jgi:hypothetical protein
MYFGRILKVKPEKLDTVKNWFNQLSTTRKTEAISTFAYESVTREVFSIFKGLDGEHYVIGLNEATNTPKKGDPSVQINQEHTAIMAECFEPFSEKGDVLLDLDIHS